MFFPFKNLGFHPNSTIFTEEKIYLNLKKFSKFPI